MGGSHERTREDESVLVIVRCNHGCNCLMADATPGCRKQGGKGPIVSTIPTVSAPASRGQAHSRGPRGSGGTHCHSTAAF